MLSPSEVLNAVRRSRRQLESARFTLRALRADVEARGVDAIENHDMLVLDELVDLTREIEENLLLGDADDGE